MDSFENIVEERVGDQAARPQGEMITGSDFKRMVRGIYSELLLAADDIDDAERRLRPGSLRRPGRDLCRTMAPAARLLARSDDDSIGGWPGLRRPYPSWPPEGQRGSCWLPCCGDWPRD